MLSAAFFPDPDQDDVLRITLERVNRACDAVGKAAFNAGVRPGPKYKDAIREHAGAVIEKFGLASPYPSLVVNRVAQAMADTPAKPPRFRDLQAIEYTAAQLKWQVPERVSFPTWKGKRNLRIHLDPKAGPVPLRPPLAGHRVALVERNGSFHLDATDVPRDDEDD